VSRALNQAALFNFYDALWAIAARNEARRQAQMLVAESRVQRDPACGDPRAETSQSKH
jgi:uncharacterized membrane protein